ncbi:glutathione peroxidase [Amphibacillus marinus]|uniref:Glutathione peroxidase n=1 Tax=Amphibacillus marinus TaxID=872970 RepID=A0A1H8JUH9_9BACI|nr:glutathione peroxidase [Amphibacillus marinus]SEN83936.1 glutathione peroxidase [Amphibacillus marinus]
MSVHQFSAKLSNGQVKDLSDYHGKVLLIVNTATKCGLKNQFNGLQQLYDDFKDQGLIVLGFPSNQFLNQEPGDDDQIQQTCQLNFGVDFPLFSKIKVNGKDAHPLYQYLTKEASGILGGAIKWNFTKFLIDRKGEIIKRYAPTTEPEEMVEDIKALL